MPCIALEMSMTLSCALHRDPDAPGDVPVVDDLTVPPDEHALSPGMESAMPFLSAPPEAEPAAAPSSAA